MSDADFGQQISLILDLFPQWLADGLFGNQLQVHTDPGEELLEPEGHSQRSQRDGAGGGQDLKLTGRTINARADPKLSRIAAVRT